MRRALAVLLALVVAASCHHGPAPSGKRTKPKLVVLIVIDQWPSWVFAKQRALFKGGIGRLLREGGVVAEGELPYASTFTAPGHAALATGAAPRDSGIVSNAWYRRDEGRTRPAEYDPDAPLFSVGEPLNGAKPDDGASAKALRVDGIAEALRAGTNGAGRSVAIALKARSAVFIAGRKPDVAVWYDAGAGGMTTSRAYAHAVPSWLVQFARDVPTSRFFSSVWDARDPALYAEATGIADDSPGEGSEHGLGAAFPHLLANTERPERAIVETPFADRLVSRTVAVALDAIELGRDDVPDFLAISYSAHDYAGHNWGPDSWEVLDNTLRLDEELGQIFNALDARVGADNWAVIVTSDHGATPLIERARIRSARRILPGEITQRAETAIAEVLGGGPWVVQEISSNVYMTPKFASLPEAQKTEAIDAAVKAISAVPGVAVAGRTDRFSSRCTIEKDLYRAICLGNVPGEGGELYVYPTAGSMISDYKSGTAHDAPFDDNRRVPILVKAPGLKPQASTGNVLQVAPTITALLGVNPPAAARERPLFKISRR